jgi:hypothetical protein
MTTIYWKSFELMQQTQKHCELKSLFSDFRNAAAAGGVKGAAQVFGELGKYIGGRATFIWGVYDTSVCYYDCENGCELAD